MWLQLNRFSRHLLWLVLWLCMATTARAEQLPQNVSGEAVFRGNYWRDRNTRVLNPTVDIRQQTASGFGVSSSYGLDAITSASVAAGATTDQPFTELRHEVGFGVETPLVGKSTLSGGYGYSTESDYFSHTASLRAKISLLQDNTVLRVGGDYTHSSVGKRLGPTGYLNMGILHEAHGVVRHGTAVVAALPVGVRHLGDDLATFLDGLEHGADVEAESEGVLHTDLDVVEIDEDRNVGTFLMRQNGSLYWMSASVWQRGAAGRGRPSAAGFQRSCAAVVAPGPFTGAA